MSADTPHRSSSQSRPSAGPSVVLPQQVTDPTILDSVAGFISDVVPAAYNAPCDTKDQIQWAHFEQLEVDESSFSFDFEFDCDKISPPPLLLVLGYTTGVQVWAIPANGEAIEILSWRHGTVRVLRFLPAPHRVGCRSTSDAYASDRPLIALCDSATPGPQYCSLSFISLKSGDQVKLFKFKNPVLDVLANRRSIVVTFTEKIAVFDAFTLEDRLTVTTCYLSPGINANPVALGARWMAYAENKLLPSRKSGGGNEGEGVQSYTATVIHAAKSLGRGLREFGETVASSLTGNPPYRPANLSSSFPQTSSQSDLMQKGIVTIINIETQASDSPENNLQTDSIVAHFIAHNEAIVHLLFDPSGLLLLTADKRGHDFHLFKIHPHPTNSALAAVHHLYILHRGDTTARVQDMCFSPDSRWATVSTLRGTTHVFPVTPYGGNVGTRTHATPHVVNRMSRFHRSAGLTSEGRSNSPVTFFETPSNSNLPYHNPRLPPYPHPTVINALAQIRQPVYIQNTTSIQRQTSGRQRLSSSSEDNIHVALRVSACFAPPRAWIDRPPQTRDTAHSKQQTKPVESLFIVSCHGSLLQYDLDPHSLPVPKEKLCDDTPIELSVCAKAQWVLQRQPHTADIQLPLQPASINLIYQKVPRHKTKTDEPDDRWLSQVEIVTHAGPHRRLWMGPQFTFKTYSNTSGTPLNILETQAIDIGKSKPVNMPSSSAYPVLIECGSLSSCEPSPKLLDTYHRNFDDVGGAGETQLKEDLAEAMLESPGVREGGGRCVIVTMKQHSTGIAKVVNPLGTVVTVHSDDDNDCEVFEDAVIHENCDEALFRPVVASKAVVLADPKIKTNPLPNVKTTVLETKKPNRTAATKGNFNSDLSTNLLNNRNSRKPNKIQEEPSVQTPVKQRACPSKTATKSNIVTESPLKTDLNVAKTKESDCMPKLPESKGRVSPPKSTSRKNNAPANKQTPDVKLDEQTLQKSTLESAFTTETPKCVLQPVKSKLQHFSDTITNPPENYAPISGSDTYRQVFNVEPPPPLDNTLFESHVILKTPDLADDGDVFDFPVVDPKQKDKDELVSFSKSLDGQDDDKISYTFTLSNKAGEQKQGDGVKDDEAPQKFRRKPLSNLADKYQGLDPNEVVSSSPDDDKQLPKKRRKPKTKLGVKISKESTEILDIKSEEPSIEVTLAPPKKSWSSVASSCPKGGNSASDSESSRDLVDAPDADSSDSGKPFYGRTEDAKDSDSSLDKYWPKLGDDSAIEGASDPLKIEKSDDDKQEANSSQTETTESDDSSKVHVESVAMDTEEDGGQEDAGKASSSQNGAAKSKKKPKKKRR